MTDRGEFGAGLCFICGEPLLIGDKVVWQELAVGGLAKLEGSGSGGVVMHFACQDIVDENGDPK